MEQGQRWSFLLSGAEGMLARRIGRAESVLSVFCRSLGPDGCG